MFSRGWNRASEEGEGNLPAKVMSDYNTAVDTLVVFCAKYLIFILASIFVIVTLLSSRPSRNGILKLAILAFPLAYIMALIASHLFYDTRPFVVEHVQPLIPHQPDNGFPSEHTLLGMVAASSVFVYHRKLGVLLAVLGILVGVSRVIAKVHHPVDIVASIAIALAATLLAWIVVRKICKV
jgi:undecaprenyl-diphosphatase